MAVVEARRTEGAAAGRAAEAVHVLVHGLDGVLAHSAAGWVDFGWPPPFVVSCHAQFVLW